MDLRLILYLGLTYDMSRDSRISLSISSKRLLYHAFNSFETFPSVLRCAYRCKYLLCTKYCRSRFCLSGISENVIYRSHNGGEVSDNAIPFSLENSKIN